MVYAFDSKWFTLLKVLLTYTLTKQIQIVNIYINKNNAGKV